VAGADGKCDIRAISLIARHYGETDPNAVFEREVENIELENSLCHHYHTAAPMKVMPLLFYANGELHECGKGISYISPFSSFFVSWNKRVVLG
jgi:hypothetical protein